MVNKHKIEFKTSRKENIVIWIEVLIYTIWFLAIANLLFCFISSEPDQYSRECSSTKQWSSGLCNLVTSSSKTELSANTTQLYFNPLRLIL